MQPLCNIAWSFLEKLKVGLPCDLAVSFLGIYQKKTKTVIWTPKDLTRLIKNKAHLFWYDHFKIENPFSEHLYSNELCKKTPCGTQKRSWYLWNRFSQLSDNGINCTYPTLSSNENMPLCLLLNDTKSGISGNTYTG